MELVPRDNKLPGAYRDLALRFPDLARLHDELGAAARASGPLDVKTCELVQIGMCAGAGLESGLRSHVRRAMERGATAAEVEQAILLGMTTLGFPATMRALSWARVQFDRQRAEPPESLEPPEPPEAAR